MEGLASARRIRNGVVHAFLVRDGLFRRTASGGYEDACYTVASLARARGQIEAASSLGNQMLSANGGAMVASGAWVAAAKPGSDSISVAPARACIRACVPRVVWPEAGEW